MFLSKNQEMTSGKKANAIYARKRFGAVSNELLKVSQKLVLFFIFLLNAQTGASQYFEPKFDYIFLRERTAPEHSHRILNVITDIDLHYEPLPSQLYTGVDPEKIEKVLCNLLSNAFKFTGQGGKIVLSSRQLNEGGNEWVVIDVADNGVGISPEDFEKIFQPFQQGSTNKVGGTGLGLSFSRALVELHGGTISVKSWKGKENHTCFTVKLPLDLAFPHQNQDNFVLTADSHQENIAADLSEPALSNEKRPVLLIVEDNIELSNFISSIFKDNYQIHQALNGKIGLQLASDYTPDLILSDVMMPEMDGLELCRKLKDAIMTSHIPIILITVKGQDEDQIAGIATGADDYINKPFNPQLLALKVKNLLNIRQTLREKYRNKISTQPAIDIPQSPDEKLLQRIIEFVHEKIDDPQLNIDEICGTIGLSRTQLYRKMKALTDLTLGDMINQIRLNRAKQLLARKKFRVSEICYMVGFFDSEYFRKCFKAEFGIFPSEYAKGAK